MAQRMVDSVFLFPPQWSPFQPALSLPSLAAWQRRAGYTVVSVDLNIEFFDWLFSDECAASLQGIVETRRDWSDAVRLAYRSIFAANRTFQADLKRLTQLGAISDRLEH